MELAVKDRLTKYPVPEFIWDQYHLDQEINDRGIRVDMQLVRNAISIDAQTKHSLLSQMQNSTGLENPNSVSQMKGWLSDKGIETESLDKKAVKELLPDADSDVADVLRCRQQLAKSSVSKYKAMENMVCADSRARGCFMFYGASRSGRWAGRDNAKQFLKDNPEIANDIEGQIRANADKLYATRRPAGKVAAAAAEKEEGGETASASREPVVKAPARSSESELDIMVED